VGVGGPSSSYWELDDHAYLAKRLRECGIPIRFVASSNGCRIYELAGCQLHVYKRPDALMRYASKLPVDCLKLLNSLKNRRRILWLVAYSVGAEATPQQADQDIVVFSLGGNLHILTSDTSVAGFVRSVSRLIPHLLSTATNLQEAT
jgi:hypothetical protein